MDLIEQPESLYNKAIIAYIVNLITKDPFRKKVLNFINIIGMICNELVYGNDVDDEKSEKTWKMEIWNVVKDVENLNLPFSIKQDVKNKFFPIFFEIKSWMEHYIWLSQGYDLHKVLDSLCWTCTGIINVDKTWKKYIINGYIGDDIFSKYRYACLNCWEENIRMLWKVIPLKKGDRLRYTDLNGSDYNLVTFWNFYMSDRLNELIENDGRSENVFGLNIAMQQGNASGVRYFWNKLTPEEKENNLITCFNNTIPRKASIVDFPITSCIDNTNIYPFTPRSSNISNLYFFLKQLSNEQARIIFSDSKPVLFSILNCFTEFSFRTLLVPVIEYILRFTKISQNLYILLLNTIAAQLICDPKTYSQLLEYIWRNKIRNKNKAVLSSKGWILVIALLETRSYENVHLILDNISADTKEAFFETRGGEISTQLIHQNKLDSLEYFLRICLTNEDTALWIENFRPIRKEIKITINPLSFIPLQFDECNYE